jgi:hypothetical protein
MNNRQRAATLGVALFMGWTAATWMLEGHKLTLLRPEALTDRLMYALVGNLLLGIVAGAACIALFVRWGAVTAASAGFGSTHRTLAATACGLLLGLAAYFAQGAPSRDPVVILNAFSQVFVVSAAEVVVCWCVAGVAFESALSSHIGRRVATGLATAAAAVLFGLYHFAHSPPFNSWAMVGLLTVVGLVTGGFFFLSRDAIGTAVFHNFLGTFGVVQALAKADALKPLEQLQPPLVGTAAFTVLVLLIARAALRPSRNAGTAAALAGH